ncbi:MAG: hypothetical protein IK066_13010 [Kiritimatiellae bacterium]|nr:hypothetical protein [Kiritimatiellia bacterium]
MSGLSDHIADVVAADSTHCIIMIREGNLTVEAARDALESTLRACDQSIANIRQILGNVKSDLNVNKWQQQRLDEDRRDTSGRHADAIAKAKMASQANKPAEAQQYQMIADGFALRLQRVNECIRETEREEEKLRAALERVQGNLEKAEWERARLESEGGAECQRLAERTSSENSLLQRMADLISGKR